MSPRSLGRWSLVRPFARRLFGAFDLIAAQTTEYQAALLSLGGQPGRVVATGSVKYDGARTDRDNPATRALRELLAVREGELVWVVGSTQPPEERLALEIYQRAAPNFPGLRLILVPRQPDRFDEVAGLLHKAGVDHGRRSTLRPGEAVPPVVLVDTIGELGALWGLADVAYVGGSLDGKRGGQNMLEPAGYGAAVTFGPHVWNFKDAANRLVEGGAAVQVQDARELEEATLRLLRDADERRALGGLARKFVLRQQGATARTVELLGTLAPAAEGARAA